MKAIKPILFIMLGIVTAGFLAVSAAHATITYTGDASSGKVGNSANGSLTIDGGDTLASGTVYTGYSAGVTGIATVDGVGSTWTGSSMRYLGYRGTGVLNVINGATVSNTTGAIGYNAGSSGTATVDGPGSMWTNNSALYVGYNAAGTLNITNGGTVTSTNGYVGHKAGSTGTVTVSGFGSAWANNGNLIVGNSGTGTLNIQNDGLASATGTTTVGTLGTINFGGGTLTTPVLSASLSQLTGTGTINTQEWAGLGNLDLVYDATHGLAQTLSLSDATRNLTINYDLSGATLRNMYVGYDKNGTLSIRDGFTLTLSNLYVGNGATGAQGTVNFGAGGGTINTGTLFASPSNFSGTGAINASGIVSDMNLVFDASHGSTRTFAANGTIVNLSQSNSGALGAGNIGTGTLTIKDGVSVVSSAGYLGYTSGSTGTATVSGAGSTWTNSGALYVGNSGTGTLNITNGASVSGAGYIGVNSGSTGTVTVNGAGSTWNTGTLNVGISGTGRLNITNGATVSTGDSHVGVNAGSNGIVTIDGTGSIWNSSLIYVGSSGIGRLNISNGGAVWANVGVIVHGSSILTIDLAKGSSLTFGNGGTRTMGNDGTIRLVAGAAAANGTYTPMSYGSMSGPGTVQALGGVWDGANHTVTVNAAATGIAGAPTTIDLANIQRVLITDPTSGHSVGAAFQAATAPTNLTITATAIADLAGLKGQLAAGSAVLSAWNFDITQGYTSGDPVYLSLFAGPNQSLSTLSVWHYDGSTWSAFTANDLAYDGTYASFTVTGFSGYALSGTAPVPVPAAVWLLGSGLAGLVGMRRRFSAKRRRP